MACLDTTFIIDLLRGKEEISPLKDTLSRTESRLAVAAPSIMELWVGAQLVSKSTEEKVKIDELLQSLIVLELNEHSAKLAGEIEAGLIRSGQIIDTEDCMIAGIAISNGETLVTRDAHFARIPGLRVLKY